MNILYVRTMLAVVLIAAASGPANAQSGAPIKVGVLLGLTGPAAAPAQSVLYGVKMWAKHMNDSGGLLGRPIVLVEGDDQFDPAQSVNEARRLTENEKVDFVVGPQASHLGLADMPVMNDAKIVWSSSSVTPLLNFKTAPYHFSSVFSTPSFVKAMVNF